MTIFYKFLTREEDIDLTRKASEIIEHYGREHQFRKLCEEASEFVAAFARLENDREHTGLKLQMMEELADMALVLQQIADEMPAAAGRMFAMAAMRKADRQMRRIEMEESHE
jgi:predicted house-cleaning noncanonical NTP pyrophosphatase (MazG superfamily)